MGKRAIRWSGAVLVALAGVAVAGEDGLPAGEHQIEVKLGTSQEAGIVVAGKRVNTAFKVEEDGSWTAEALGHQVKGTLEGEGEAETLTLTFTKEGADPIARQGVRKETERPIRGGKTITQVSYEFTDGLTFGATEVSLGVSVVPNNRGVRLMLNAERFWHGSVEVEGFIV